MPLQTFVTFGDKRMWTENEAAAVWSWVCRTHNYSRLSRCTVKSASTAVTQLQVYSWARFCKPTGPSKLLKIVIKLPHVLLLFFPTVIKWATASHNEYWWGFLTTEACLRWATSRNGIALALQTAGKPRFTSDIHFY